MNEKKNAGFLFRIFVVVVFHVQSLITRHEKIANFCKIHFVFLKSRLKLRNSIGVTMIISRAVQLSVLLAFIILLSKYSINQQRSGFNVN